MSSASRRMVRLLQTLLVGALTCGVTHAQIREEKPTPGLEEGLSFFWAPVFNKRSFSDEPTSTHGPESRKAPGLGTEDFSIAFALPPNSVKGSVSSISDGAGWKLNIGENIQFSLHSPALKEPITVSAPLRGTVSDAFRTVVISVKREARQPLSGIWIDGIERVSVAVPPANFSTAKSEVSLDDPDAGLELFDLRIYNRALTRPEILELTLRGKEGTAADKPKPKHPTPPANGPRFIPQPDETIALIGGTEAVALAESGELEALLLMAFPQTRFHFRSLAWEGDTVFKQDRPMNFGSLEQQLRRVNAGAVFVMFGRQECLDAAQQGAGLAKSRQDSKDGTEPVQLLEFKTAFGKLLDTVAKVTPNIVVIGPPPFEQKAPPLPGVTVFSPVLRRYSEAMSETAKERALVFSDVLGCDSISHVWEPVITQDGVVLNSFGISQTANVATFMLRIGLGSQPASSDDLVFSPGRQTPAAQALFKSIATKNRLWHDYWRPSNWAFLHGDRTNQPSSRDPVNPQVRLFPAEQEKYLPLIKEAEDKIHQLVQEAQKKLP